MSKQQKHHKKHHKDHHQHQGKEHHQHHRKHRKKTIDNPIVKTLLEGVYEDDCVLSQLRGCPHLLKEIWRDVRSYYAKIIRTPNKNQHQLRNDLNSEEEEEGEKGI